MNEQLAHTPFSADASEVKASTDTWILAKKRANDYLKLHRLPEAEREHLLTRITHKLARAGLFSEQELIQLFISTAQKELALLQVTEEKSAKTHPLDEQDAKADRTQTGPRFERSSIRVAPLQAITLLPTSRQRLGIK
ncbi:hypothetical protein [Thiothrix lacustris]|uniref:hypothetical protein n=1 Tax=Thiothrix lacustris TaxID=525917 RepID=UPI00048E9ECC|nr:hypothetical protein [Thiothrix lacustris]